MPMDYSMLAQMASGVGAAMNQQPWSQALNQITQQNISAKNQAGLIDFYKQILSGKMPGAKANLSDKGMNLTLPSNIMGLDSMEGHTNLGTVSGGGSVGPGHILPTASASVPATPNVPEVQNQGGSFSSFLNPQDSQPSMPSLAGLSTQDISNALSGALNIEQLRQKKIMDVFESSKPDIPKDERTAAIKNYEYSVSRGSDKTFDDFQKDARTAHEKNYERAVSEGYEGKFHEWLRDITALGGGLSIGEKIAEKRAFSKLQGELFFDDPDWIDKLSKHMSSKSVRSKIILPFMGDPVASKKAEAKEKFNYIKAKIESGKGVITKNPGWSEDGKTIIFTVRWPSGEIGTIKHAIME